MLTDAQLPSQHRLVPRLCFLFLRLLPPQRKWPHLFGSAYSQVSCLSSLGRILPLKHSVCIYCNLVKAMFILKIYIICFLWFILVFDIVNMISVRIWNLYHVLYHVNNIHGTGSQDQQMTFSFLNVWRFLFTSNVLPGLSHLWIFYLHWWDRTFNFGGGQQPWSITSGVQDLQNSRHILWIVSTHFKVFTLQH